MKKNLRKILIIEDDPAIAQMYGERLSHEGYEVYWAKNGIDGVNEALVNKPDLVILDIYMPQKGGLGVLQVLRTFSDTRDIPVIVLSNSQIDEYRAVAKRHGVIDFLSKANTVPHTIVSLVRQTIG